MPEPIVMPNEDQEPLFELSTKREGAPEFLIGIGHSSGPLHAIAQRFAAIQRSHVGTVCGTMASIARSWGEFVRGNEHIDRHQLCPECAWLVALEHGTADNELARRRPRNEYLAALRRCLPDPLLYVRVIERLLELARENDTDHDEVARLLGHVTVHQPTLLMGEDCTDNCEHDSEDDCYGDEPTVVCLECSVLNGSWAGEWEGQVHIAVPPCGVLAAVAAHYGVLEQPCVCGEPALPGTTLCNLHTPIKGNVEVRRGGRS